MSPPGFSKFLFEALALCLKLGHKLLRNLPLCVEAADTVFQRRLARNVVGNPRFQLLQLGLKLAQYGLHFSLPIECGLGLAAPTPHFLSRLPQRAFSVS